MAWQTEGFTEIRREKVRVWLAATNGFALGWGKKGRTPEGVGHKPDALRTPAGQLKDDSFSSTSAIISSLPASDRSCHRRSAPAQPFPAAWVIGPEGPVHLVIELGTHERQPLNRTGLSDRRMVIYATGE